MYTFKIQVHEEEEIRRITLQTRPNYTELRGYISHIFASRPLFPGFGIKYYDDEGDLVTIATDFELASVLSAATGVIRLVVCEVKKPQPTPPTPAAAPASVSTSDPNLAALLQQVARVLGQVQQSTPADAFNCPHDFLRGLMEWYLEEDEEAVEVIGKLVRRFIKAQLEESTTGTLPSLEELIPLASDFIELFLKEEEVVQEHPWLKLISPDQARGLFKALAESPIIQEITFQAYKKCQEKFKKSEAISISAPIPIPQPVDPLESATPQEREGVLQLEAMGFRDRKKCLEMLRTANYDLWDAVQLLSN